MKKLCVNDILERVNGTALCGLCDAEFAGACIDSRIVQSDEAYFALKGERTDGTLYCGDAIKNGAETYEEVEKQLRFGTGCGKCKEFIGFLVRDILEEKEKG